MTTFATNPLAMPLKIDNDIFLQPMLPLGDFENASDEDSSLFDEEPLDVFDCD